MCSSTPSKGLRKRLSDGRAIKGKSTLSDAAYQDLEFELENDKAEQASEEDIPYTNILNRAEPSTTATMAQADPGFEVEAYSQNTSEETPSHLLWLHPNAALGEVLYDPQVAIDVGEADALDMWMVKNGGAFIA